MCACIYTICIIIYTQHACDKKIHDSVRYLQEDFGEHQSGKKKGQKSE